MPPERKFHGWVITEHPTTEGTQDDDIVAEDGRLGWGSTSESWSLVVKNLIASDLVEPVRFRLYDDDGNLCFGGVISESWLNGEEHLALSPLAFGTADEGCTYMKYEGGLSWHHL